VARMARFNMVSNVGGVVIVQEEWETCANYSRTEIIPKVPVRKKF